MRTILAIENLAHDCSVPMQGAARDRAERLAGLSSLLPPNEGAMVHAVFGQGVAVASLARAMGVAPRRLQRRLARVLRRMNAPAFRLAALQRRQWPALRRSVAELVIFRNRSLSSAAQQLGVSRYRVRQEVRAIAALAEETFRAQGRESATPFPCARATDNQDWSAAC